MCNFLLQSSMWKKFLQRWPLSALYWLPTGIAFNQYMYTLKIITGSSMQVRSNLLCADMAL